MTPDSTFAEVRDFLTLLAQSEVAVATTAVVDLPIRRGGRRVTWANNAKVPGDLFRYASATVSEYREWVDRQGYSAVLYDGSLIQISYDFEGYELVGHRLVYFPCPFDIDQEMLDDLPLAEVIDLYRSQERPEVRLRSPIRFDYGGSLGGHHPASHMTFEWSHARIPVMAPISLGHFVEFVFKNFYPPMWNVHDFLRDWPKQNADRTITPEEQKLLHLNAFESAP